MILVCIHCSGQFRVKGAELEPGRVALVCPACGKRLIVNVPGGAAVASRQREPAPRVLPRRDEKRADRETVARAAVDDLLKPIAAPRPVPTRGSRPRPSAPAPRAQPGASTPDPPAPPAPEVPKRPSNQTAPGGIAQSASTTGRLPRKWASRWASRRASGFAASGRIATAAGATAAVLVLLLLAGVIAIRRQGAEATLRAATIAPRSLPEKQAVAVSQASAVERSAPASLGDAASASPAGTQPSTPGAGSPSPLPDRVDPMAVRPAPQPSAPSSPRVAPDAETPMPAGARPKVQPVQPQQKRVAPPTAPPKTTAPRAAGDRPGATAKPTPLPQRAAALTRPKSTVPASAPAKPRRSETRSGEGFPSQQQGDSRWVIEY